MLHILQRPCVYERSRMLLTGHIIPAVDRRSPHLRLNLFQVLVQLRITLQYAVHNRLDDSIAMLLDTLVDFLQLFFRTRVDGALV